jgi:hypothetical protein
MIAGITNSIKIPLAIDSTHIIQLLAVKKLSVYESFITSLRRLSLHVKLDLLFSQVDRYNWSF